jgi:hypothetical protein
MLPGLMQDSGMDEDLVQRAIDSASAPHSELRSVLKDVFKDSGGKGCLNPSFLEVLMGFPEGWTG